MSGTPGERLEFLITKILESRRERSEFSQLIFKAFESKTTQDEQKQLIRIQGETYQKVLRLLIVEGQSTGEVAVGDPDQLVMAITACLDGLSKLVLRQPQQFEKHFPDVAIIMRMLLCFSNLQRVLAPWSISI